MPVLRRAEWKEEGVQAFAFWCPGCKCAHMVWAGKNKWRFNGDLTKPTFHPSLLVTSGHYIKGNKAKDCWCTYAQKHPDKPVPYRCYRCHSFVEDGNIRFLKDSTHELAGQTVPIPLWDDEHHP